MTLEKLSARLLKFRTWIWSRLRERTIGYWVWAVLILLVSTWISPFADEYFHFVEVRYWLFQHLNQSATNPAEPRTVKLVMIGDDEFWDGPLAHRIPTNRSYLARVIRALDRADASVVAVDIDLRLPHQDDGAAPGDFARIGDAYRTETDDLVSAIDDVAQNRPVVMARTALLGEDGSYYLGADALQPYGLCMRPLANGQWDNPGLGKLAAKNHDLDKFVLKNQAGDNIYCGYLALPFDMRQIPPPLDVGEKGKLDAFSYAVVRARDRYNAPMLDGDYYTTYIPSDVLKQWKVSVSARDLLSADPKTFNRAKSVLHGSPVIVGAAWNRLAFGFGGYVDMHDTPIELTSGVLIHENFAEALLAHRRYPGVSAEALHWLEFGFGLLAMIGFALSSNIWIRLTSLIGASVFLFVVQWATLQFLGTFFEAFIPVFGVGLHSIIERLVYKD